MTRPRHAAALLTLTVLLAACASDPDGSASEAADVTAEQETASPEEDAPAEEDGAAGADPDEQAAPQPEPEPEPAYTPPPDWQERALEAAEQARQAVVAIGWNPPTIVLRRIEAGWLVAPDLVVTSPDVACEAREGQDLRIRTFDGQFRTATVETIEGPCSTWEPGVALLRLASAVDAPVLSVRTPAPLTVGEPLLAIGHSNQSAAIGGWLVLAGPVVEETSRWVWTDIGATVNYRRVGEFFGGGFAGAPVIDLDGEVVTVLCCEQDWGPRVDFRRSPLADPVLRRRLTIDESYFTGGMDTASLAAALRPHVAATG